MPVEGGICEDTVLQVQEQDISLLLSEQDEVHMELEVPDSLTAPVEAGKTVGWETYYVNGEVYAQLPITTAEDVLELTYRYCLGLHSGAVLAVRKSGLLLIPSSMTSGSSMLTGRYVELLLPL